MGLMKSLYADLSCEEVFELESHCDHLRNEWIAEMEADAQAEDEAAEANRREAEDRVCDDLALDEDRRVVAPIAVRGAGQRFGKPLSPRVTNSRVLHKY